MKSSLKKIGLISAVCIVLIVIGYLASPHILSNLIEKRINASIEKLKHDGIEVRYDSLHASLQKIVFKQLQVIISGNNNCIQNDSIVKISTVRITGLQIIPLLLNNSLRLDSVVLENPVILHTKYIKPKKQKENDKKKLKSIFINHISVSNGIFNIADSAQCQPNTLINFNGEVAGLMVSNLNKDSIRWSAQETLISNTSIKLPYEFYTVNIKKFSYHPAEKTFLVDSIHIIPDYNKSLFAQKIKKQTDRIEGYIPFIKGKELKITNVEKLQIHAGEIDVKFSLDIFRDKRYPFKNKVKSLPVKYLHDLPFSILVDTVHVKHSYVAYGEFQEDGTEAGKVFFDELNCQIYNISNYSNKETTMKASAKFMDDGHLKATFTFPTKPESAYSIKGTLSNFSLPEVNSMLTTAARAKISTGTLEAMKFNFTYNNTRSDGTLELNYKDLKMTSLLKNKEKNKFLTFILRLVVKEDMDKNLSSDKKKGEILFYRDKQRSIFNYWWKSILSGIKSVYNLDKITDTDGKH